MSSPASASSSPDRARTRAHGVRRSAAPPAALGRRYVAKVVLAQACVRCWLARRALARLRAQHRRRTQIVNEILLTERQYVSSVRFVVQNVMGPLSHSGHVTPLDVQRIFSSADIIYNTNRAFLASLEERMQAWGPHQCIGDLFLEMTLCLRIYTEYIGNYSQSISVLSKCLENPNFAEFLKNALYEEGNTLDLPSLLIMPVQRVPRYTLLLKDLVKSTDPAHPDFQALSESAAKMHNTTSYLNEKSRDTENMSKVVQVANSIVGKGYTPIVDPKRKFIREGVMRYIPGEDARDKRDAYVCLFNDVIVCARQQRVSTFLMTSDKRKFIGCVKLHTADVVNMEEGFQVIGEEDVLWLVPKDMAEKKAWIKDIKACVEEERAANDVLLARKSHVAEQKAAQAKTLLEQQYAAMRLNSKRNNSLHRRGTSAQLTASEQSVAAAHAVPPSASASYNRSWSMRRAGGIYSKMSAVERHDMVEEATKNLQEIALEEDITEKEIAERVQQGKQQIKEMYADIKKGNRVRNYRKLRDRSASMQTFQTPE